MVKKLNPLHKKRILVTGVSCRRRLAHLPSLPSTLQLTLESDIARALALSGHTWSID